MAETKVVLIAGASSEIGQATGQLLVQKGYRVFGTSRDIAGLSLAGVEMVALDVTSDDSVAACLHTVLQRTGRLDVLINLVSYVVEGAFEEVTLEEAKALFETNFFGMHRLAKGVLPTMRHQREGMIINVSALSGVVAVPYMGMFTATRFAVEGATEALWHEVRPFNVHVSLLQIMSPIKTQVFQRSIRSAALSMDEYRTPRQRLVNFIRQSTEAGPGPNIVAEAFLRIIETRSPRIRYRVGPGATMMTVMRRIIPDTILQRMLAKRMLSS
ncbi:MAG: SDR family NAD(P)-dependent oxidoreductase [Ignavibacteriales bacterium]|nr:SDR family NAD(P)-dependent oxidoreductase [Ignavibacteriales bacterium]